MTNNVKNRCIQLGEYISNNKSTVRQAAFVYGISKSTVHIDVTKRLQEVSPVLAESVNKVLQNNKAQRHIRGGEATRNRYKKLQE